MITRLEGGAGTLALRGARGLDLDEFEPVIVAGRGDRRLDEARAAGLETIVEPSLRAPIAPHADVIALWRLAKLFREREFDVVHTHCAKAGALGRVAARHAGVRRIVHTFHGFPFHEFQGTVRRRAYVGIEHALGRITDTALCVGVDVASEAIRKGLVSPERVRTIGVAVDQDAVVVSPESRRRARIALGLPPDAAVVGAVGRLTYQKAPQDFIAALRTLGKQAAARAGVSTRREVVGVWIGGGDWAEQVRELAEQAVPEARVLLVGERADVVDLLPALDVFVQPSRYEGLPLSVVEAMVCGIPVVATAVNAVGDVVVPGETGLLVPPGRPDSVAGAIGDVLDHPEAAQRRALAARRRIDDRFSMRALADVLTTTYGR